MNVDKTKLSNSDVLSNIPIEVSVVVGKTSMTVKSLMSKSKGDFIHLDADSADLVTIFANNKLIAKGEIVVSNNKLGVVIKEIVS